MPFWERGLKGHGNQGWSGLKSLAQQDPTKLLAIIVRDWRWNETSQTCWEILDNKIMLLTKGCKWYPESWTFRFMDT